MAIYPIRTFGDPVLRAVTEQVEEVDYSVRRLAEDMLETMYDAPGVGLAAPQIGVVRSVIVLDVGEGAVTIVNPVLVDPSEAGEPPVDGYDAEAEWEFDEGCLSVPGYYWPISRPSFAWVRGLDLDGQAFELAGNDLLGRVLQHEVDHLDGQLLLGRLPRRERKQALKDIRNDSLGLS